MPGHSVMASFIHLTSRVPRWSDMEPVDIISQWCDDWSSASVVNCDLAGPYYPFSSTWSVKEAMMYSKSIQNKPRTVWNLPQALGLADSDLCACGATQYLTYRNHVP